MYDSAKQDYLSAAVLTADPVSLVGMLYEGLERAIQEARAALRQGEILRRSRAITLALEIIAELNASLDRRADAQLAGQLARLFEYMVYQLTRANTEQAEPPLEEVARLAATLGEAWRGVANPASEVRDSGLHPVQANCAGAAGHVFSALG